MCSLICIQYFWNIIFMVLTTQVNCFTQNWAWGCRYGTVWRNPPSDTICVKNLGGHGCKLTELVQIYLGRINSYWCWPHNRWAGLWADPQPACKELFVQMLFRIILLLPVELDLPWSPTIKYQMFLIFTIPHSPALERCPTTAIEKDRTFTVCSF